MRKPLIIFLFILIFFSSCKKNRDNVSPNMGYSYAGLDLGSYIVYDVDSYHYNKPFNVDTIVQFQIKEVVDARYMDLEGEEAFKIIRYRKEKDSTQWVLQDVWNAKRTITNYQKDEENIRYIKLIFPVRDNKNWNGNAMNNNGAEEYEYVSVNQREIVGSYTLDSVLTVLQFEDVNLVQERFFEEKYAAGIGLISKKSVDIDKAFNNSTGLWERDTGNEVVMTIAGYGN
ncbi:MAG: hypothetical protein J5I47_07170 [Vicingus serpentipes]|nr:hypothetical protein [Vicingus serpentipes]